MAQFDRMLDRQIRGLIEYEHAYQWVTLTDKCGFCSAGNHLCVLRNGT